MKKVNKVITTLLLLGSLAIATTSTFVNTVVASTDDTTNVQKTTNDQENKEQVTQPEPILQNNNVDLRNTITGDLGISKVWVSGGKIYYALKITDPNPIFAVYKWSGTLTIHYYASGSKKARTVNYPVGGMGRANIWWEYSHSYTRGRHGYAVLSGTIDGFLGKIKFPRTAF